MRICRTPRRSPTGRTRSAATARARRCHGKRTRPIAASRMCGPWLPVGSDHVARAVDREEAEPDSLLHLTRSLLSFPQGASCAALGRGEAGRGRQGTARLPPQLRRRAAALPVQSGAQTRPPGPEACPNRRAPVQRRRGGAGRAAGLFGMHPARLSLKRHSILISMLSFRIHLTGFGRIVKRPSHSENLERPNAETVGRRSVRYGRRGRHRPRHRAGARSRGRESRHCRHSARPARVRARDRRSRGRGRTAASRSGSM